MRYVTRRPEKRTQNVPSDVTRVQAEQKSDLDYVSRREQSGVSSHLIYKE